MPNTDHKFAEPNKLGERFHKNHRFSEERGFGYAKTTYYFPLTDLQIRTLEQFSNVHRIQERGFGVIDVMTDVVMTEDGIGIADYKESLVLPNGNVLLRDLGRFSDLQKTVDGNYQCQYLSGTKYAKFSLNGAYLQKDMILHDPSLWYTKRLQDTDVVPVKKFRKGSDLQVLFNRENKPMWVSEDIDITPFDNNFAAISYFNRGQGGDKMVIMHHDHGWVVRGIDLSIGTTWFDNDNNMGLGNNLLAYYRGDYKTFNPTVLNEYVRKKQGLTVGKHSLSQFKKR